MPYPGASDLTVALAARGIEVDEGANLDLIMAVAAKSFEADTGFRPFLADASASARLFGLREGSILFLKSGIPTTSGLVVSIDGDTQVENTDFFLLRPADGMPDWPYTQIHFQFNLDVNPDDISVTAKWGFATELPDIAKHAIIAKGMAEYLRDVENAVVSGAGSASRIKQGPVEIELGASTQGLGLYDGSLQTQYSRAYERAVGLYQAPWLLMA